MDSAAVTSGSHEHEENEIKKHPLMNTVILHRIFHFSNLDAIKNCRIVCQTWNSVVEPILRKRAKIVFKAKNSLGPSSFCDTYKCSEYLPFTAFTMTRDYPKEMVSECTEFFTVYGNNIKTLRFERVHFEMEDDSETGTDSDDSDSSEEDFDLTTWIEKAPNLTTLKIDGSTGNNMQVPLNRLTSIKFLNLVYCTLLIDCENGDLQKISADEIILEHVDFKQNGNFPEEVLLNDYFNFRHVSKLYLEDGNTAVDQTLKLDMAAQELKINIFHAGIQLDNWREAKGKVKCLSLSISEFAESNALEISELFCSRSNVDFTVLPKSLKKLTLSAINRLDPSENSILNLPNLKYLFVEVEDQVSLDNVRFFKNCHNLVEVEFNDLRKYVNVHQSIPLNPSWLPKNLKKLKIHADIEFIGDEVDRIEVDTLILKNYLSRLLTDGVKIISKIKPKILVADCRTTYELDTTDVIRFVVENTQLEKIVFGSQSGYDLYRNTPFETSLLSYFVEKKKANYYEFEKQHGIPLSAKVFNNWINLDGMDPAFEDLEP